MSEATLYSEKMLASLAVQADPSEIAMKYLGLSDRFLDGMGAFLVEGARESLAGIKARGFRLAVASNIWGSPESFLQSIAAAEFFEAIEHSMIPGYCKPSPYMLLRLASFMQLNPRLCGYIGDTVDFDVAAAQRAGMIPILVTRFSPDEADRAPEGTLVVEDIRELESLLI